MLHRPTSYPTSFFPSVHYKGNMSKIKKFLKNLFSLCFWLKICTLTSYFTIFAVVMSHQMVGIPNDVLHLTSHCFINSFTFSKLVSLQKLKLYAFTDTMIDSSIRLFTHVNFKTTLNINLTRQNNKFN